MSCPRCGEPVPNMSNNHKCKGPEKMNIAFNQSVSSQQACIEETWSLGTERDELKVHIRELEAELEARKKAWKELNGHLTRMRRTNCGAFVGTLPTTTPSLLSFTTYI